MRTSKVGTELRHTLVIISSQEKERKNPVDQRIQHPPPDIHTLPHDSWAQTTNQPQEESVKSSTVASGL